MVLDLVIRVAVIVVASLLIREFWSERIEPNGDGVPVRLLVAPLVVYIGWNVNVIVRSVGALRTWPLSGPASLASIGLLSAARLLWLEPLAGDWWWRHRQPLTVLMVASVVCTILTLGEELARAAAVRRVRT